jgi:putative addiction module component (TIGR02574 family)
MIDTAIIEKEAMQLPEADRALLADRLIQSLSRTPATLRDAWVEEADARMNAYRAGKISAVDGPQAMAELRSRFER